MKTQVAGPVFVPGVTPRLPSRSGAERRATTLPGECQWQSYAAPFRHYSATDVFDESTYGELAREFSTILEVTHGRREGKFKLRQTRNTYDALVLGLNRESAALFSPLFTEEWLRPLAEFIGIDFLPRIEGALHSNPQGSGTGWIHTDFCSAWFDESRFEEPPNNPANLQFPPRGRCDYFTGSPKVVDAQPREYIRAMTMIYYLCNDGWKQGDGGETALYSGLHDTPNTDRRFVPPVNNSLVLFECSPHSYHRFLTNPGRTRNSIILWLHTNVETAEARWGDGVKRRSYLT